MSEEKVASGEPVVNDSVIQQETEVTASGSANSDVVKYETYKRTVSEAKKAKAELNELREQLEVLQTDKLKAEGNKDELIETLRKQVADRDERLNKATSTYAQSQLSAQIKAEAAAMGCVDTDLMLKAIDISGVDVDAETFQANRDDVKRALDDLRRTKPILFNKQVGKIDTTYPTVQSKGASSDDTNKMSQAEYKEYIKRKLQSN